MWGAGVYMWGAGVYMWGAGKYMWGAGVYMWGAGVYMWGQVCICGGRCVYVAGVYMSCQTFSIPFHLVSSSVERSIVLVGGGGGRCLNVAHSCIDIT